MPGLPAVVPVVTEAELPPGVLGPTAQRLDVRCHLVPHRDGIVLVDTGIEREPTAVTAALSSLGATWADVTDVVVTHAHLDHVAGLEAVVAWAPGAVVWSGEELPVPARPAGPAIRDLTVLPTPGHTPGHLSLVRETDGLVFTGDAVGSLDGVLTTGPAAFTADAEQALGSLRLLLATGADRLLFGHGDEVPDAREALTRLVAERSDRA